jgi:hypothetical protein
MISPPAIFLPYFVLLLLLFKKENHLSSSLSFPLFSLLLTDWLVARRGCYPNSKITANERQLQLPLLVLYNVESFASVIILQMVSKSHQYNSWFGFFFAQARMVRRRWNNWVTSSLSWLGRLELTTVFLTAYSAISVFCLTARTSAFSPTTN